MKKDNEQIILRYMKAHIGRLHAMRIMYSWGPDAAAMVAEEIIDELQKLVKMCDSNSKARDDVIYNVFMEKN